MKNLIPIDKVGNLLLNVIFLKTIIIIITNFSFRNLYIILNRVNT